MGFLHFFLLILKNIDILIKLYSDKNRNTKKNANLRLNNYINLNQPLSFKIKTNSERYLTSNKN